MNGPSTPRLGEQLHNDAHQQAQDNKDNKSTLLFRGVDTKERGKETSERTINVDNCKHAKQQKLGQQFELN